MKVQWNARSIIGLVLVIVAVLSLLIDLAGIVQIWVLREPVTRDAINTLDLLNSTLDTTSQGLGIAKTSLKSVTATIGALQATVQSAASTIDSASTSVGSVGTIVGSGLTNTINSALGTLDVVERTTSSIDQVLAGLANIPLLNIQYDPETSLTASVSDLTDQLRQVPDSLGALETNLSASGSSLEKVGNDAAALAVSLGQVERDMSNLVGVIEQYEVQVKAFQGTIQNLRSNIFTIVWGVVLFATFILLWLGAIMVQTLINGLTWMGLRPRFLDAPIDS